MGERNRGKRKVREGTVVSAKMNKTVVVSVSRTFAHPLYGKTVTRSTKYHARDDQGAAKEGDFVRLMETRPLSKTVRWRVVEVLKKAVLPDAGVLAEDEEV